MSGADPAGGAATAEVVDLYRYLQEINRRPSIYEKYTAESLWTDPHTSSKMLEFHLDGAVDVSSRTTEFIDRSASWIISRFGLGRGKKVADLGCGPGLYTVRLAASEAAVTGIDFSGRSVAYARQEAQRLGLQIEHVHANYLEFTSDERFDLMCMIMCDYCALSAGQRRLLLDRILAHLRPGGALLLDVYSLSAFHAVKESASYAPNLLDGFWSSRPYFGFMNVFRYESERVAVDKYTIVEDGRARVVLNWLQYFDREMLKGELEGGGLVVEEFLGDVGGKAFDPASNEFAVIARKPPRA